MESPDQYDNILMDIRDYCSNDQWSETLNSSYFFNADPIASVPADHFPVQTSKSMNQFDELAPVFATHVNTNFLYQKPSLEISTEGDVPLMPFRNIDPNAFSAGYSSLLMITPPKNAPIERRDAIVDHSVITCRPNGFGRFGASERRAYKSGRKRLDHVGYDEIRKYFRMPIAQAAREMNVGLIVLMKRCRELGIDRWPHRKMKSLESLIRNFQEMGNIMPNAMIQHELEMLVAHRALMEVNPAMQLTERTKKLRQKSYKRRRAASMHSERSYFGHDLQLSERRYFGHYLQLD